MSQVSICPTCGSKAKIKEQGGAITYQAVQDEEAFQKVGQLKKALQTFKSKVERLELEIETLKSRQA
ncbi:hypothetical protein [Pontibacter sp. G13]|uniref:hypothetical protein n=1 Tax=Pontibacter sp. G13 TaxID=3074898 RepID=UPI00288B250D|nr:hypothetical protein [Pontibacter sp. G13]WNJ17046.1 hypothetical protein RJD25_19500 [Pontibacter sp. G13]